jgi:hypothetical protein
MSRSPHRRNRLSAALAGAAVALTVVIWFVLPHDREVSNAGLLLFKLAPFACAAAAIACADDASLRRWRLHLVLIPGSFLVFFCFFVPRVFFYSGTDGDFPRLYYHMLTAVPFIILALTLAFRLGGGPPAATARLALAMLLLMLSGLEDLAFLLVNPHTDPRWTPIPAVWTWASHIEVFIGHPPSRYEAYAFITAHVLLAIAVLVVPGRFVTGPARRLAARVGAWRRTGPAPVPGEAEPATAADR